MDYELIAKIRYWMDSAPEEVKIAVMTIGLDMFADRYGGGDSFVALSEYLREAKTGKPDELIPS